MGGWTTSQARPGYIEKTIQHGAATIVIFRPAVEQAEQARREDRARTALESAMKDYLYRRTTA